MSYSSISPTHRRIAHAILDFERQLEPAFVADLVRALNYAAESSLTATLRIMERNGILVIKGGGEKGRSRVVALTPKGRFAIGAGGLPLLGSIPAGPLEEALAEADQIIETHELLPTQEGDFLLRVKGDSMIGDGILDRDLVLIRPNIAVSHGEIAAVLVGDVYETTLKHVLFAPKKSEVTLRASNPKYQDIVAHADSIKIAGVYRGLVRSGKWEVGSGKFYK